MVAAHYGALERPADTQPAWTLDDLTDHKRERLLTLKRSTTATPVPLPAPQSAPGVAVVRHLADLRDVPVSWGFSIHPPLEEKRDPVSDGAGDTGTGVLLGWVPLRR